MKEADVKNELMKFLKAKNGAGPIIKHADMSTLGLPDVSVTGGRSTIWLELKLVKYKIWKDFDLRRIVEWNGPQSRLMSLLDYHGTAALYAIFFYRETPRAWHTIVLSGVNVANICNAGGSFKTYSISQGKDFEWVWNTILKYRKEFKEL